jgi:hypothetical protein
LHGTACEPVADIRTEAVNVLLVRFFRGVMVAASGTMTPAFGFFTCSFMAQPPSLRIGKQKPRPSGRGKRGVCSFKRIFRSHIARCIQL